MLFYMILTILNITSKNKWSQIKCTQELMFANAESLHLHQPQTELS